MLEHLISERAGAVHVSGIRRIFGLAQSLEDPINLSIGQPDFPVPEPIRRAAVDAIGSSRNGYTLTQGAPDLLGRVNAWLAEDLGWDARAAGEGSGDGAATIITSGTSGALLLAFLTLLNPGDECVIPDPYFVAYPHMATIAGGRAVRCDTYPDFAMTAERVEPLITERTKFVLFNTPSNPCGVVATRAQCDDLRALCRERGVLLISDEIYDEFVFSESLTDRAHADPDRARCPSPARDPSAQDDTLLIRGFGKTYGCTGWRLGYASGPRTIIDEMAKLQQYTFVCAPAPLQAGVAASFDIDMGEHVAEYERRRDMIIERLGALTRIAHPGGAFYAFVSVPERLGMGGTGFAERAVEDNVLVIPGGAFSDRDTHFRISFATDRDKLERGLDAIAAILENG